MPHVQGVNATRASRRRKKTWPNATRFVASPVANQTASDARVALNSNATRASQLSLRAAPGARSAVLNILPPKHPAPAGSMRPVRLGAPGVAGGTAAQAVRLVVANEFFGGGIQLELAL
jgi:hypothetical protein